MTEPTTQFHNFIGLQSLLSAIRIGTSMLLYMSIHVQVTIGSIVHHYQVFFLCGCRVTTYTFVTRMRSYAMQLLGTRIAQYSCRTSLHLAPSCFT